MDIISEKVLEPRLKKDVEKKGGLCVKFVSPGNKGVPDRLILMPGGFADFVEVKTTGQNPDPLQWFWIKRLRAMGFKCPVVDDLLMLNEFVNGLPTP